MFTFMDHQFVFGKKGFVTANLIAHKVQLLGMNVGLVSPPTRSCAVPEKRKENTYSISQLFIPIHKQQL